VCLAAVVKPTLDSLEQLEESGPLLLTPGFHLGLCYQAALFTKLDEALPQQQLASVARLCEPPGSRPVGQSASEERLYQSAG